MSRIHRLDPIVANQIAAGEVVERPASVVKELVENSLDANSQTIDVSIDPGHLAIEVRDDGDGIDQEDLPRAIERHSTSKLTQLADLEHSRSLGFRGEALAAIASVSELTISSRPHDHDNGHRLTVTFGQPGAVSLAVLNPGTRIAVDRIFEQQPARLKALRTPAAEVGAIQQTVQQLAIARVDVQMRLTVGDRIMVDTPGHGDVEAALLSIFGRDLASSLLPVEYRGESGLYLHGYVAPADHHRANRFGQGLYVNGRWVTNWALRAAVEEAFRPNVPDRRFPYFWLWLELEDGAVDPNAHPTKAEVRLVGEHRVRALLHRIVKETLTMDSPGQKWSYGDTPKAHPGTVSEPLHFEWTRPEVPGEVRPVLHQHYRDLVPLAQWRAKYIIAQGPEGLCLVDQHAAHERIYFERFRNDQMTVATAQPLLLALSETLSATEWAVFTAHRGALAEWGFEVESLGGTTVAIRAVPSAFHDLASHQGLLRTVLELLGGEESTAGLEHPVTWAQEAYYAMAACKAAIKANRPLSMVEMQSLLDEMSRVQDPRGCPHGRPTLWVLTIEEVDRRFGRTGR